MGWSSVVVGSYAISNFDTTCSGVAIEEMREKWITLCIEDRKLQMSESCH